MYISISDSDNDDKISISGSDNDDTTSQSVQIWDQFENVDQEDLLGNDLVQEETEDIPPHPIPPVVIATPQQSANRRRRPIGLQCNMDTYISIQPYFSVGEMTLVCEYCQARGYKDENKGTLRTPHFGKMCCNNNKIELPLFPALPPTLHRLFTDTTANSIARYFQDNMRKFNAGMAMASLQVNDATVRGRCQPGCFKVWGQLHRRIGPLLPSQNSSQPTNCMQTYFRDAEYQDKLRASRNGGARSAQIHNKEISIFQQLRLSLTQECSNSYLRSFVTVNEYIQQNNLNPDELQIELHAVDKPAPGQHIGRLHLPTAPEIALLLPTSIPRNSERRVVCNVRSNNSNNDLQFIQDYHRSYIPLLYVLFFPHGTDGWSLNTRSTISPFKKVTLSAYVRYHMMQRNHYNHLLDGRKLFQQYITDEWARIEMMRLKYIESHQRELRADLYHGVVDSSRANDIENSGQQVILPASYTMSDRWYNKSYKNAMALVRALGKPTLFITMTMDIKCPEVMSQLKPGQSPYDHPELLCRIFEIKRKKLMSLIIKDGIFGKCIAHVAVIEFQKRGAPHSHILIWIENFDMTPHNIDNIISAEIPPRGEEGSDERAFHDLVIEKMIHGPCGRNYNTRLACCSTTGTCKRKFPRDLKPRTVVGDGCFPEYRRRSPSDGGHTGRKRVGGVNVEIDNGWVVPYSPFLLTKFRCHINVEFCHTVTSVKYLFLFLTTSRERIW